MSITEQSRDVGRSADVAPVESLDHLASIYEDTAAFYQTVAAQVGNLGFQILYGPPFKSPPILFLGYQPGGGEQDRVVELAKGSEDRWPPACEYATEAWRLARNLRSMFGEELLRRCVGLNAIFVRAPNIDAYRKTASSEVRQRVQEFCISKVRKVVEETEPQRVVAIGFETLSLFGKSKPDLTNSKGRTLTRIGDVCGVPAIGVLHLSGAHISNDDRRAIASRALSY